MPKAARSIPTVQDGMNLLDRLLSGETIGMLSGRSIESVEAMYYLAHTFYGQGKYAEALKIFGILVIENHVDRRFHGGLAACMQMLRRHEEALKYYGISSMLDLTDPDPVIHMAECYLALGERAKARESLDYALLQARGHSRHHAHVGRIEAMLSFLDAKVTP